jgi:cyclopropane fatty-acyl-phospholipid synthase-like methyltransferase
MELKLTTHNANTLDHWREKHVREYDLDKPYDFSQIEQSPLSYHTIAAHILNENRDIFKNKSLLEIGCAGGYFSTYVATHYLLDWQVTGWGF